MGALAKGSSDAVPIVTMIQVLFMWFGLSVPLVFFGAYFGFKQDAIEFPVNTSSIPRQVPDQPFFLSLPFVLVVGGILPFGACFVELWLIMNSLWMDMYYYVFGFLLITFFILVITCAEITILFRILSPYSRKLSLVVACICHTWFHWPLSFWILMGILPYIRVEYVYYLRPLLWIYGPDFICYFFDDWYDWRV